MRLTLFVFEGPELGAVVSGEVLPLISISLSVLKSDESS